MKKYYRISEVADMLSVPKGVLLSRERKGTLVPVRHPDDNSIVYSAESLKGYKELSYLFTKKERPQPEAPKRIYNIVELFSGCGGLALGMEKAGLTCQLLNEIDHRACETLRKNRPQWNVIEDDVSNLDFIPYCGKIDVVVGGFPCQSFSYAGKKLGLQDTRGTLFYEFARAIKEIQPLIAVGENVRGLLNHEKGQTLAGMISVLEEIGYDVLEPRVLQE